MPSIKYTQYFVKISPLVLQAWARTSHLAQQYPALKEILASNNTYRRQQMRGNL